MKGRWWALWSLLPLGLGAWAPIYGGIRHRRPAWIALGLLWCGLVVLAFVLAGPPEEDNADVGFLLIGAWIGGAVTSFVVRPERAPRVTGGMDHALHTAQRRLADREAGLRLARERPELALEMGVGRPDLRGAADAGLVDVNHARAKAIASLPGIDRRLAWRVVEARDELDGFTSLEDMGVVLDLPGDLVEDLRGRVVFLPR